jgi:hypothetical protein
MENKKVILLFLIVLSIILIITYFSYKQKINYITKQDSDNTNIYNNGDIMEENKITVLKETSQNKISKKRHIFLDLGTNNGDSVKFFVDKAEKSSDGYKVLQGYGALDNKKWEIYAIEANPYFNKILTDVKVYCENLGHKFNLLTETAAWTKNEKLVFYLDTVNKDYDFWGSSLIKDHPDVISSGYKNVTVNGIDISEILKKYNSDDEIVMKIDIEGKTNFRNFNFFQHIFKKRYRIRSIIAFDKRRFFTFG